MHFYGRGIPTLSFKIRSKRIKEGGYSVNEVAQLQTGAPRA